MSGGCSKHKGHDDECRMCLAQPGQPEPARRWTRNDMGFISPTGNWTPPQDVEAALNETESLRARVTELEALLTRDGHETGCSERYPASECFCHRLSGRGETDGGPR